MRALKNYDREVVDDTDTGWWLAAANNAKGMSGANVNKTMISQRLRSWLTTNPDKPSWSSLEPAFKHNSKNTHPKSLRTSRIWQSLNSGPPTVPTLRLSAHHTPGPQWLLGICCCWNHLWILLHVTVNLLWLKLVGGWYKAGCHQSMSHHQKEWVIQVDSKG